MQKANQASVPRSEKVLGRADCLAGSSVGDVVRITGVKVGPRYQVAGADPSSAAGVPAVGVIVRKDSPTDCVIQFHGPVKDVYAGLTQGIAYFLGTDSALAKPGDANFPTIGGTTVFLQLGVATSDDEFLLHPQGPGAFPPGAPRIYGESLSGATPGTVFTTLFAFLAGTEQVFVNGQRLPEGTCYARSESGGAGTGFDTITFVPTIIGSDHLLIDYDPA